MDRIPGFGPVDLGSNPSRLIKNEFNLIINRNFGSMPPFSFSWKKDKGTRGSYVNNRWTHL